MIRHSILYFLARAGNGLFSVATLAVFTRLMTPSEYGTYALGLAAATIASSLFFQWLNVAVGRFYPTYRDTPEALMSAADKGYLIAAGISTLVFSALLPFYPELGVSPALIVMVFLVTLGFGRYNMTLQLANAQMSPARYAMLSWIKTGLTLVAGSLLIIAGAGEYGALVGLLIALLAAVVVSRSPSQGLQLGHNHRTIFEQMLRYGLPLTLTFISIMIVDLSDRIMIGWLLGTGSAGPYAAAYDLTQQTIGVIMNVFFLAVFPAAVHALETEGDTAAGQRVHSLGRAIVAIGLPFAIGFAALAPELSELVFGAPFREEAVRIMPWVAAAVFVGAYKSYYLDAVFQLRRLTNRQARIALVMASANIGLNLLLIPLYGTLGAAWATLAAFAAGSAMSWWFGRELIRLPPIRTEFAKSIIVSSVMTYAMLMTPQSSPLITLSIKIPIGCLVFILMANVIDLGGCRSRLWGSLRKSTLLTR